MPTMLSSLDLSNQFAYLPTRSTSAALITIFSQITSLLKSNDSVFVITFDYSKAFDTISHSSVATILANLPIPYNCYNWIIDYLSDRSQYTLFKQTASVSESINAGVVQGSVLGPTLFNMVSSTLKPLSDHNKYYKYADDGYLIVPGCNSLSIDKELEHHAKWAASHNLKLNLSKTMEIVFTKRGKQEPPPNAGITRVDSLKILGVTVDKYLNFQEHVNISINACSSSFFALRTMKSHGLNDDTLRSVFCAKILPKLTYCSQAWWGFVNQAIMNQLESFLRRAVRCGYYLEVEQILGP